MPEEFVTDDDHVDDQHAQVVNDNADLEEVPAGPTERVADQTGVRGGLGSAGEPEDHVNGGFRQHGAQYDHN